MYLDKIIVHNLNDSLCKNDVVHLAFSLLQTCDKIASVSMSLIDLAKTYKDEKEI